MIADGRAVHAVRLGLHGQFDELARGELLRRRLVSEFEFSHVSFLLLFAYTRGMPAALTAITDTVYFAQTDLVNWTLAPMTTASS